MTTRNLTYKTGTMLLYLLWLGGVLGAVDFNVRLRPYLSIPRGESKDYFVLGGGGDLSLDTDLSSIFTGFQEKLPGFLGDLGYSLGVEAGINVAPLYKAGSAATFYSGGLGASLFYYPFSRLNLRVEGVFGMYQSQYRGTSYANTCWKYGGEAGFRFSPNWILSLNGGYRQYNHSPEHPNYEGFYGGLSIQFYFEAGQKNNEVRAVMRQEEPLFPIFLGLYRQNPIGILRISNHESAEIRNVVVNFRAGNYTASRMVCGTIPRLGKHRSAEIPLYADFAPTVLNFSENGRIPGDVLIEYELLGAKRSSAATAVIEVYNRNSFRWNDRESLAVFISPTAPEVQDYSKYIAGIARNYLRTGLNRNMQFAMFLYEGLRAANVTDSQDQETPYRSFHQDPSKVDYIQFPFQTLAYRSGDLDDLGILYAASLESAGIKSALIPLERDFLVAFSLGINQAAAEQLFYTLDNVLVINDEVWIPLALGSFKEGFVNSWYTGMNQIGEIFASQGDIDFIIPREAWQKYPPAAISVQEAQLDKPPAEAVARMVELDMLRYIAGEFNPKIEALRAAIGSGGGSPGLYNQMGLLYTRAGMYREARAEYQRSAAMGNVPAMVNLGNLSLLEKDPAGAESWFKEALRRDPSSRTAAEGLNRILTERLE
jgi:TPR repeat protein